MATTTYTVSDLEGNVVGTASKKQKAVALADKTGPGATVVTGAGTIVHEVPVPKKIKMSAPYTRVVAVPDEVAERIDGARVAYKRGRRGAQFALLDDAKGDYRIWDVDLGQNVELDEQPSTTREAGRWFADERDAYRAAHPVPTA